MFTAEQKFSICEILSITMPVLDAQLNLLGDDLTAETETYVISQIELWNAGASSSGDSWFTPTESNKGFNTKQDSAADRIRGNVARALQFTGGYGSSYSDSGLGTICIT